MAKKTLTATQSTMCSSSVSENSVLKQLLRRVDEMEHEMKALQGRVKILEEENTVLKKENEYLGLVVTSSINEDTMNYVKRMWGDEFSPEVLDGQEGTYAQILQCIFEESTNDGIDMFVVSQLGKVLVESRIDATVQLSVLEQLVKMLKHTKNTEDFTIVFKCICSIIISNSSLIGICIDTICRALTDTTLSNRLLAIEALYSASINNTNEQVHTTILNAILPCIQSVIHREYPTEYCDIIISILKTSCELYPSLRETAQTFLRGVEGAASLGFLYN